MLELFYNVRAPVDDVERMIIRAFSEVPLVDALWIREIPRIFRPGDSPQDRRRFTRAVYVQLAKRSQDALACVEKLTQEMAVRFWAAQYVIDVRVLVDELPPADVAPSCVFRRTSGRV